MVTPGSFFDGKSPHVLLMNAAILDDEETIMSAMGRQILACVKGPESFEVWKHCFQTQISFVNDLEESKFLEIPGFGQVEIELYLGGDYNFLLMVLGMNAAMAKYACLFCYVHAVSQNMSS